jgi:hypothetical protein
MAATSEEYLEEYRRLLRRSEGKQAYFDFVLGQPGLFLFVNTSETFGCLFSEGEVVFWLFVICANRC